MEEKKILLAGFGPLEEILRLQLQALGCGLQTVQPSQYEKTIGELCRYGQELPTEENPDRGTVLFWNFTQQELDPALKLLRQAQLPAQPHKAMVTKTNWHWKLSDLIEELAQEQQVMAALIRLKRLRDQMPMPDFMDLPAMQARMQAEVLLKGGEGATVEALEKAYAELEKFAGR